MAEPVLEERLLQFWIFQDFAPEALVQVGHFVEEKSFPYGQVLYRQGDPADSFYLVEDGVVQEVGQDAAGNVVLRRRAVAGDYIGRWSLMQDAPHRATASVLEKARMLVISADDFRTLLAMFPRLREHLQRTTVVNRLLATPVFGAFSEGQLFQIADLVRIVEYPAGQLIFHQGEPADAFYVIDTGQVIERAMGTVPGRQSWPKYLTAGNFFGRYSLMNNTLRRASAEAVTDVRLFRLGAEAFHWLRQLQPEFERALKRPDLLGHLRSIQVFSVLGDEELKHLAGYVGLAHFRPRDVLYRQGEIDPTFYILYEGEAIVRTRDEAGKDRPRSYLKVGDAVGEASLFLQEPRDVTVEATTKTNWFYLTAEDLDQFLAQHPSLADRVIPREEVRFRWELSRPDWIEPDELLVLRRRRHWFFLVDRQSWPFLLSLVALIILLALPQIRPIGWFLLASAALWMLWRLIDWLNDHYAVTTSRVVHQEKVLLLRETRDETPLDKIQNVNIDRGLFGNLFGFGTLVIDSAATAGASRVTFTYLAEPEQVQALIFEQMSRVQAGEHVEVRRIIRDKLEESIGPGIRPTVPRPAVPSPAPAIPPPPPSPGIWDRVNEATVQRLFWIEKRSGAQIIWRKHWIQLLRQTWLPALASLGLLLVLLTYLIGLEGRSPVLVLVLAVFFLLTFSWFWWEWVDWGNDLYIVTNDRIIDIDALPMGLRSSRTETTFDRIQNVSFEIPSPVATLLNYGTVIVYTAGVEGRLDFLYVADPRRVQAEIFRRLGSFEEAHRRQQREDYWGDLPEWFAEYDRRHRF